MKLSRIALFFLTAGLLLAVVQPARASIVADYNFNGNTNDSSGNGYNGTVNGAPASPSYTSGAGISGQAFVFNGGQTISTTTTDNLDLVNHSFSVVARVDFANLNDMTIFGTTVGGNDLGLHMLMRSDKTYFGFYNDDTGGSHALSANQWYTIGFVYDASTHVQTIYLNGAIDGQTGSHNNFQGTGETAYIGTSCCAGQFNGLMDNLWVYNTALSQTQIQQIPEPATLGLLGLGACALFLAARRRRS